MSRPAQASATPRVGVESIPDEAPGIRSADTRRWRASQTGNRWAQLAPEGRRFVPTATHPGVSRRADDGVNDDRLTVSSAPTAESHSMLCIETSTDGLPCADVHRRALSHPVLSLSNRFHGWRLRSWRIAWLSGVVCSALAPRKAEPYCSAS
jgi:hypothetical protein